VVWTSLQRRFASSRLDSLIERAVDLVDMEVIPEHDHVVELSASGADHIRVDFDIGTL
jgi:hypothetical protein